MKNYEYFLEADLQKFAGKWIAIIDRKIVSSGENLKEIMEEVKKNYPKQEPLVVRAPTGKSLIL